MQSAKLDPNLKMATGLEPLPFAIIVIMDKYIVFYEYTVMYQYSFSWDL